MINQQRKGVASAALRWTGNISFASTRLRWGLPTNKVQSTDCQLQREWTANSTFVFKQNRHQTQEYSSKNFETHE